MDFVNGLNVIVAPNELGNPFIEKLEIPKGFILLNKDTKPPEVKDKLKDGQNIIIYTHNDEIIKLANKLYGINKDGVISLKV